MEVKEEEQATPLHPCHQLPLLPVHPLALLVLEDLVAPQALLVLVDLLPHHHQLLRHHHPQFHQLLLGVVTLPDHLVLLLPLPVVLVDLLGHSLHLDHQADHQTPLAAVVRYLPILHLLAAVVATMVVTV